MSMETNENESDLDLIYMSDWSADMHGHDTSMLPIHAAQQHNKRAASRPPSDIPPGVSYANVFPGVKDDNDADTVNSNTPVPFGAKKNVIPTIATIYEPKFFEIYQQYYQFILHNEPELIIQNPNQQHLMTLCLNYLLSFSNWARDAVNGNWIRASLFENPDMRPEVRNGLAMIIVYVFASARAADARSVDPTSSTDMFTVLMKAESGMGIVNKTSLKIYSDPFGYFNFVKTCISGLIDASAIPENERVSTQATKKSRRGSRNKDEVEAYQYVKNQLIAMFQSPDSLQLAKDRINQILEFWHVRGKMIRNERFTSVFSLPPPVPGSSNYNAGSGNDGSANSSTGQPIYNTMSSEYITIPGRSANGATRTSNRSSQGSGDNSTTNPTYFGQQQNAHMAANAASVPFGGYYGGNNANSGAQQFSLGSGFGGAHQPGPNHPHLQINDNDSVVSDSGMSSASRSPHPSFMEYNSSARSSGALNFRYTNATNISALEDTSTTMTARPTESSAYFYQQQFAVFQQQQQQLQQVAQSIPIPSVRFDRQGMLSWSATTSLIYDLDTLLQQNNGRTHFYLVDEQKFKRFLAQEVLAKNGNVPTGNGNALEEELQKASTFGVQISYTQAAMGLGTMDKMLMKSNAVSTSWMGQVDASQLRVFVEGWRNHIAAAVVQNNNNSSSASNPANGGGRRSARSSHIHTPPNGGLPLLSSMTLNNNNNNTGGDMMMVGANNNSTMMMDDNASVSSSSNSRQPRLSRRRTTGGVDLKRDVAKLMSMHQFQQDQAQQQQQQQSSSQQPPPSMGGLPMVSGGNSLQLSHPMMFGSSNNNNNNSNNMFSPPKGMSPLGPSPSMTFGKTINNTSNNTGGMNSALTSPLAGNGERKSFNNNNGNNSFSSQNSNNMSTNVTMLDYWQLLNTGHQSFSANGSRGILVFERSNEIGLVIRANAQYGLMEDLWCLYYPDDAMQQFLATVQQYDPSDRLAQSFASYLMQLLPQLRVLMKFLVPGGGGNNHNDSPGGGSSWQAPITVSYFAHTSSSSGAGLSSTPSSSVNNNNNNSSGNHGSGPPMSPPSMQHYRTLGSIDQNAHLLLSRLVSDAHFHEIVLL